MAKIVYSLSQSKKEITKAFDLVHQEYIKYNYLRPKDKLKTGPCFLLPSSATFIAKLNQRIVGTISLAADSKLGLPMDEIYKKELDKLRASNKKIAEVCRLAINSDGQTTNNLPILLNLFKLVLYHCLDKKFDNICIAINPKHNSFYNSLSFKDIGGLKYYPAVNNAPALAKTLELSPDYLNQLLAKY